MSAKYPRVSAEIFLTAVEREGWFHGQIWFGVRLVWESPPEKTPTLAYGLADQRLAAVMEALAK